MTNAEKYLKEGVNEEEFVNELHYFWWANEYDVCDGIRKFLHGQAKKKKPTLTEDERVILRNLQNVRYIGRTEGTGYLYATFNTIDNYSNRSDITDIDLYFSKMFPFIKERRRIFNRGVIK